jgi:hypothetical protein
MIKKHNILDKIIKRVLAEQTLTIPVTIKKFSIGIGDQIANEKLGCVFAFRVTAKSKEQKVDDAGTKVKLTPTADEVLRAIKQRLEKTKFPEIDQYKTANYWWIQSNNISTNDKIHEYVFFVYPKATLVGVMNPIVPNNLNEFPPKVDYYIDTTSVTKAESQHFKNWASGETLPDGEWLENNATTDINVWNTTLERSLSINSLSTNPLTKSLPVYNLNRISRHIKRHLGLFSGELQFPREEPEYLKRKDQEEFDSGFTLYGQELKFTGTNKYVRSVGQSQIRKYIGFFKEENGDIVLRATVLSNEQDSTTNIQTGNATNLEVDLGILFTGNITNDKITQGTIVDTVNNKKYVGTFNSKQEYDNGLEYKNDELVRIYEKNKYWDYVKNSTVTNESSQYQIRELQSNILKMWSNNTEFVSKTAPNNKYLINKFIQNGITGIWDTPTKEMVTALNLIFIGPDPDTGKPYAGSDTQIRAEEHEQIVKYATTKIPSQ